MTSFSPLIHADENILKELNNSIPGVIFKLDKKDMGLSEIENELGQKAFKKHNNYYFSLNGYKENFILELDKRKRVKTALYLISEKERPNKNYFNYLLSRLTEENKKKTIEELSKDVYKHESGRFYNIPVKGNLYLKFKNNSRKPLLSVKVMK